MSGLNRFHYESPDEQKYYFWNMLQGHSNIGNPPVKFIEDFGANQSGSTVRDWRINPRTITLEFFKEGASCCETRGEMLADIINKSRPNRGLTNDDPGYLRFLNDSEILMEIPTIVSNGLSGDFDYSGNVGKHQVSDNIQFYASDPIWREVGLLTETVGLDDITFCLGSMSVDIEVLYQACLDEFCLSSETVEVDNCLTSDPYPGIEATTVITGDLCLASSLSGIESEGNSCLPSTSFFVKPLAINYEGTWDGDQINIRLNGSMDNPTIYNTTLGTKIELTYFIPEGDYVDITIRPEYVIVEDNNGNNLIGSISSISDLVDFVVKSPGAITPTGLNEIFITAVEASSESSTEFSYWTRHISAYGNPQCD